MVLQNARIRATVLISPEDPEAYKGVRFDHLGQIVRVDRGGVPFLGAYASAAAHDTFRGIMDEFDLRSPWSYTEEEGEPFLKLGVGWLVGDEKPYRFYHDYPFAEPLNWKTEEDPEGLSVRFEQELKHASGIHVRYSKTVEVDREEAVLRIRRRLTNFGSAGFSTRFYSHHMLRPGRDPISEDTLVRFGPVIRTHAKTKLDGKWAVRPHVFELTGPVTRAVYANLEGEGKAQVNHAEVINQASGHRVRFSTDLAVDDVDVFYHAGGISPELFSTVTVPPGATRTWTTHYHFEFRSSSTPNPEPPE